MGSGSMNAHRIMVVEDDYSINQLIKLYLEKEGFRVEPFHDGYQALSAFRANPPSLVVLDIMLPGLDGWDICREIRKISDIPIIMLTAKGETFDKVLGLELGADDYMVKPFDPKELIARIKAVLRRHKPMTDNTREVSYPNLTVSLTDYTVTYHGKKLEVPPGTALFPGFQPNKVFGNSCWNKYGALIFMVIPELLMYISSVSGKSSMRPITTGRSKLFGV